MELSELVVLVKRYHLFLVWGFFLSFSFVFYLHHLDLNLHPEHFDLNEELSFGEDDADVVFSFTLDFSSVLLGFSISVLLWCHWRWFRQNDMWDWKFIIWEDLPFFGLGGLYVLGMGMALNQFLAGNTDLQLFKMLVGLGFYLTSLFHLLSHLNNRRFPDPIIEYQRSYTK